MDFTCKTRALTSLVKDIQKKQILFQFPFTKARRSMDKTAKK